MNKNRFSKLTCNNYLKLLSTILNIGIFIIILLFFTLRLNFIIKNKVIGNDTTVFLTVGNAISQGYKPWIDYWSIKPMGIFLIHALSWKLSKGFSLSFIISTFFFIFTAIFPIVFFYIKKKNKSNINFSQLLIFLSISLLFTLETTFIGGWMYPEFFGIFFSSLYIISILLIRNYNFKNYIILALIICLASNTKEPFCLILFSLAIIFCKNKSEFLNKFIIPSIIALMITIVVLIGFDWHKGFLKYLSYMLSVHAKADGQNIFLKGFELPTIFNLMNFYLPGTINIFIIIFGYYLINIIYNSKTIKYQKSILVLKAFLSFYTAIIAIRCSGYLYPHHFMVFFPIALSYLGSFLLKFNNKNSKDKIVFYSLVVILIIFSFNFSTSKISDNTFNVKNLNEKLQEAKYIDAVLDKINEKRYMFFGQWNNSIFGLTKHLPMGPYFFQEANWEPQKLDNFYESLYDNVNNAKIVVLARYRDKKTKNLIQPILKHDFTLNPYDTVKDIKRTQNLYKIYFRK